MTARTSPRMSPRPPVLGDILAHMATELTFDVYGRVRIEVRRTSDGSWAAYRKGSDGKSARLRDLVIPDEADHDEIQDVIEVAYHEFAEPGRRVRRMRQTPRSGRSAAPTRVG